MEQFSRAYCTQGAKKILVIAPHGDDEVLGCGGYLLHQKEQGAKIQIVIGTIGGDDKRQKFRVRLAESKLVATELNADFSFLYKGKDAKLDTVPAYDIISQLDKIIDSYRPDEIFLNYKSHHQDHIKVHDCAMAAIRLREGYSPKLIALYEYPFITGGGDEVKGGRLYFDISKYIEGKVRLFELYASQIRQAPSPLNASGIKTLAAVRGLECGIQYAERFYIQKMILQ